MNNEATTFFDWSTMLVNTLAGMSSANTSILKLAENMKDNTASSIVERRNMMNSVTVEVFKTEEVHAAAAESYGNRRGSMGSIVSSFTSESSEQMPCRQLIMDIIASTDSNNQRHETELLTGQVLSRDDLVDFEGGRNISLVKIDLSSCGDPPYNPGGTFCCMRRLTCCVLAK